MQRLEIIEGEAWRELVATPVAVVVLARSTCPVCRAWSEELAAFLAADERWKDVRFGEIFLDRGGDDAATDEEEDDDEEDGTPGAILRAFSARASAEIGFKGSFARANGDWLAGVEDLPHNVLYVRGARVKAWPGAGVDRLLARLEGIERR